MFVTALNLLPAANSMEATFSMRFFLAPSLHYFAYRRHLDSAGLIPSVGGLGSSDARHGMAASSRSRWPPLDAKRKLLGLLALALLMLTVTPVPIAGFSAAKQFPSIFGKHQDSQRSN